MGLLPASTSCSLVDNRVGDFKVATALREQAKLSAIGPTKACRGATALLFSSSDLLCMTVLVEAFIQPCNRTIRNPILETV